MCRPWWGPGRGVLFAWTVPKSNTLPPRGRWILWQPRKGIFPCCKPIEGTGVTLIEKAAFLKDFSVSEGKPPMIVCPNPGGSKEAYDWVSQIGEAWQRPRYTPRPRCRPYCSCTTIRSIKWCLWAKLPLISLLCALLLIKLVRENLKKKNKKKREEN